ncbi:hypothetical protein FHP25_33430 [Vineibacter terrae]|uniref:Uncharacterized protein n=1 Tax=Vineibacter terrae TaxID=2586908 RepID=A0A5C8PA72_9HYPH|nr:hypothetical protein [Vineibacter terrae]TXL70675.1 hypothetical protein FHP25_33430 [Vineibacter terrae]
MDKGETELLTPSKMIVIAGAMALLGACAERFGPDSGTFPVAAIRADMATLNLVPADFDRILEPVPSFYRWAPQDVPVALVMGAGLDRACARKTSALLDQSLAELSRDSGIRFTRAADPAQAKILLELAAAPAAEKAFREAAPLNLTETLRNPPTEGPKRWEAWQLSDTSKKTIERAYVFDGKHYTENSSRNPRLNACKPFDFPQFLRYASWKLEIAPLNWGLEKQYTEAQLLTYDRMLLRIVNASAVAPGASGREVAFRLKRALQ